MESEFKARKPNLATFGQIIYYISSRILKNHSVESRKDLITSKKYGISDKSKFFRRLVNRNGSPKVTEMFMTIF